MSQALLCNSSALSKSGFPLMTVSIKFGYVLASFRSSPQRYLFTEG
jgi:hypothetical protein